MLLQEVQKLREELEGLIQQYMQDGTVAGFTAKQLNWPTADDVVTTLRSGQPPEATYGLLRQFAIMHRNTPVIVSDRGNVLYIDYNPNNEKVFLYIGSQEEFVSISEVDGRKLYCLVVDERYDFLPYGAAGTVCKLRIEKENLVDRIAQISGQPGEFTPALYFYIYDSPTEVAICTLRTEWTPRAELEARKEAVRSADTTGSEKPLLGQCASWLLKNPEISNSKLKPATDPRIYGTSNRSFQTSESPDELTA